MTVRMFLRLLAVIYLATGSFVLGGRPASADELARIKQRGTLVVGVKTDYPPFGFRTQSSQIVGIEPDLAAAVAKSLSVHLQLVPVTATNRIQLLEQGRIDLIIATMNDTMVRRSEVDIVKPYYYAAGYNVMAPKSMNLQTWADLKGKSVCGVEGAYYNFEAAANFGIRVTAFANLSEALAALKNGRCAGLLFDDVAIEGYLPRAEWSEYDMPLESQEVQPWGIAVREGQPALSAYISTMVKTWVEDGTIVNLETKYHIRHSSFAEDAHARASEHSGN
jgi:polar amino acid transport system substrate-binding protein